MTPAAADYLADVVDLNAGSVALSVVATRPFADTLARVRNFLGLPDAFGDGAIAFHPPCRRQPGPTVLS